LAANRAAASVLRVGGPAIAAAENGVWVSEGDPEVTSVGYGGLPNREGVVELDAAIIDGNTREAGAVAGIQGIKHPIRVAALVMKETPHVLLVGEGARRFAIERGFPVEDLLTEKAKKTWEEWRKKGGRGVPGLDDLPGENHDTIGMVVLDRAGNMAASCTTSGLRWKLPGRVGDSPLIGHGLYCDTEAGGAAATGIGEEVIKVCGSYQVVEFMRQGVSPEEAARRVLERILKRDRANRKRMVGFVAIRRDGEVGYASTTPGFQAAIFKDGEHKLVDAPSLVPGKKKE
ncbi:MAG: N(4)-(beta-N-acetylglucosaminyl)-L-asparaginase, partial [Planctomycetota bacterium]